MDDSVEVYLGDLAQISCQYSFTDVDAEPSDVIVQWFVVSTARPAAKTDTAHRRRPKVLWSRVAEGSGFSTSHFHVRGFKRHKLIQAGCQDANNNFTAWKRSRRDAFMDSCVVFFGAPQLTRAARQMEMSYWHV